MKKVLVTIILLVGFVVSFAQDLGQRLSLAVKNLEADPTMKYAIIGFNVVDAATGKQVFNRNSQVGLAPASSQKIFTSIAAFELLGHDYRYKTVLGYDGKIESGVLKGNVHITGSGDPTLGSWRWKSTREEEVLTRWVSEIKNAGIRKVEGLILDDNDKWSSAGIPDSWIWQDIGNYYGAGAYLLNWRENQYDVLLKSGNKVGALCEFLSFTPSYVKLDLSCEVVTAEKGSGDNAYIYVAPGTTSGYIRGSIPAGQSAFGISGSLPFPSGTLVNIFNQKLNAAQVIVPKQEGGLSMPPFFNVSPVYTHLSPPLDSINYWFLKKSINLYGEALMKTMAMVQQGVGSTEKGVALLKAFWAQRGIEQSALNIMDGCGLSPQSRVTSDALVKAMSYARLQPWFKSFYNALPEINGITMKSGSINGARSYTGYVKSKNGNEYTFAIIVNNYDGNATDVVRKMWRVLDILK